MVLGTHFIVLLVVVFSGQNRAQNPTTELLKFRMFAPLPKSTKPQYAFALRTQAPALRAQLGGKRTNTYPPSLRKGLP